MGFGENQLSRLERMERQGKKGDEAPPPPWRPVETVRPGVVARRRDSQDEQRAHSLMAERSGGPDKQALMSEVKAFKDSQAEKQRTAKDRLKGLFRKKEEGEVN